MNKVKAHNSVKEENTHAGDKWSAKWVSVSKDMSKEARAKPTPKSWSSTIRCKKRAEQRGGREVWSLGASFVCTSTKQQKKALLLKYTGMLTAGGNNRLKNSWVRQLYYRREGWSTFLKSAMKWAKIFSELGRTSEILVHVFWKFKKRTRDLHTTQK